MKKSSIMLAILLIFGLSGCLSRKIETTTNNKTIYVKHRAYVRYLGYKEFCEWSKITNAIIDYDRDGYLEISIKFDFDLDQRFRECFDRSWENIEVESGTEHSIVDDSLNIHSAFMLQIFNDYIDLFAEKFNHQSVNLFKLKNHLGQDNFLNETIYIERIFKSFKKIFSLYQQKLPEAIASHIVDLKIIPHIKNEVKKMFVWGNHEGSVEFRNIINPHQAIKRSEIEEFIWLGIGLRPVIAAIGIYSVKDSLIYLENIYGSLICDVQSYVLPFGKVDTIMMRRLVAFWQPELNNSYLENNLPKRAFVFGLWSKLDDKYHYFGVEENGQNYRIVNLMRALMEDGVGGAVPFQILSKPNFESDFSSQENRAFIFWRNLSKPQCVLKVDTIKIKYKLKN